MPPADRQALPFDVRMALAKVPAGILRDLGKRRGRRLPEPWRAA